MRHIRVFFAIELEDQVKEYLVNKQEIVQERSKKGNFTLKNNIHLTLKFIGEVSTNQISSLKKAVDIVADQHEAFDMLMNRVGKFDRGNRSIVWIGLEKNIQLENIYKDLEQTLSQWGYEKETRKYRPHITIGRQVAFKENESIPDIDVLRKASVNKISLMESTRIDGVLTYVPLHSRLLCGI